MSSPPENFGSLNRPNAFLSRNLFCLTGCGKVLRLLPCQVTHYSPCFPAFCQSLSQNGGGSGSHCRNQRSQRTLLPTAVFPAGNRFSRHRARPIINYPMMGESRGKSVFERNFSHKRTAPLPIRTAGLSLLLLLMNCNISVYVPSNPKAADNPERESNNNLYLPKFPPLHCS